jgi:hypothetical protein
LEDKSKDNKEIIKNNSNKKEKEPNNKKSDIKTPEIKIESSNEVQPKLIIEKNISENNTKEKNLPSLSHTFHTNSNPNKKVDIEIEPRAVFNLIEIIKFIIQRKVFLLLYETYINKAIRQQYAIAFSFFVAICKQYPFRKLDEYCNYLRYKFTLRHLFKPFIRRSFKKLRKNFYYKRKIGFLIMVLNQIYRKKTFKDIKNFWKLNKLIKCLIKPILISNFVEFKENINLKQKINNEKERENKNNKKTDSKNKNKYNDFDINDNDNIDSDSEIFQKKKNDDSVKMNSYLY